MTGNLIVRIAVGLVIWAIGSVGLGAGLGAILRRADDTPKDW